MSAKTDHLIRHLTQYVKRGMVLFEAISPLAQVSESPLRTSYEQAY